jgi:hypothetical protein
MWLALVLAAVAVVGYLWWSRRSSGAGLAAAPSGASAASPADTGSGGGLSGSPDLSSLLSSLQGENQELLDSFLRSQGPAGTAAQIGAPVTTDGGASGTDGGGDVSAAAPTAAPSATQGALSIGQGVSSGLADSGALSIGQGVSSGLADSGAFTIGQSVSSGLNYPAAAPAPAARPSATSPGQRALNERPVVTPHGKAL